MVSTRSARSAKNTKSTKSTQRIEKRFDKSVQKWATRLTAIATIIGVLAGGSSWVISQLNDTLAGKIEAQTTQLQQEVQSLVQADNERDGQTELQLTRLELMMLIQSDPTNIVEIEKVARHYFHDLGGNAYLTSFYSKWAKQYGGDTEVVIR